MNIPASSTFLLFTIKLKLNVCLIKSFLMEHSSIPPTPPKMPKMLQKSPKTPQIELYFYQNLF